MEVTKVVLIATPSTTMTESMRNQIKLRSNHLLPDLNTLLLNIENEEESINIPNSLTLLFRNSVIPYVRSAFFIDPKILLCQWNKPVLIFQGTNDKQVEMKNGEKLLRSSVRKSELAICEGMNHVLVNALVSDAENFATYNNPKLPLNAKIIKHSIEYLT